MAGQVHNSHGHAKAELRRRLVAWLGGPQSARVFETHAGPGVMHHQAFAGVADWLGVDQDPRSPDSIHADNRLVLRAVDLQRFNFFDVDAFGSPWEQVWIVSRRRKVGKGEFVALALTDGHLRGFSSISPVVQGWSTQLQAALGIRRDMPNRMLMAGGGDHFAQRLIAAWFGGCKIVRWVSATGKGQRVFYFGCVIKGQ